MYMIKNQVVKSKTDVNQQQDPQQLSDVTGCDARFKCVHGTIYVTEARAVTKVTTCVRIQTERLTPILRSQAFFSTPLSHYLFDSLIFYIINECARCYVEFLVQTLISVKSVQAIFYKISRQILQLCG